MDQLVGPWIETSGKDLYRVSPLANSFGREMLTLDEQASIHKEIAVQMLRKREIDVIDANSMLMHAIGRKVIAKLCDARTKCADSKCSQS